MSVHLIPFDEVRLSKDPNYLVQRLLPRTGISVLWGPPKSGKTFWLFDLMTQVASNRPYRGRKVNGGAVIYCCFEGIEGYGGRIAAIKQHGPQDGLVTSLYLMPARLDFAADYSQIIEAVKERLKPDLSGLSEIIAKEERLDPNFDRGQFIDNAIAQRERNSYPAAIVLDTLNRSFIGSESNDEDMTAYIRAADAVKNEFECAVIIVHHSGHDASRPRGHSSLTAAIDAQLSVKRSPDDHVIVEVEWMRDGPEGERVVSRLKQVQVGTDTAGDPITSCIVVPSDDLPATAVASSRLKAALQAFDTVAGPDGAAESAMWRDEMRRQGIITNKGNPRSAFKRIKDNLIETKQIAEENGIVRRANRTVPGCVPSVPFIGGRDGGTLTPRPDGTPGDGTGRWDAKREAA